MTATDTADATPTIADLDDEIRTRLVRIVLDQVHQVQVDKPVALLWLTGLGLTPDGDVISHALAARHMRDNIADGTYAPADVDGSYTCSREEAQRDLVALYQGEYDEAVRTLATPATPTPVQNSRRRLHLRLARDHGVANVALVSGVILVVFWGGVTLLVLKVAS